MNLYVVQVFHASSWKTFYVSSLRVEAEYAIVEAQGLVVADYPLRLVRFPVANYNFIATESTGFEVLQRVNY